MLILSFSASARAVYAFPLIAPLAILAAPSALTINKIIDRIWIWTSAIIFLTLSAGIWVIWLIMMTYGTTPKWRWISQLLPSSFIPHFDLATVIIAAVLTLIAIVSLKKTAQTPRGGLISWVIGMTLVWTLMSTLMMPWLDCGKSYRTVFQSIPWPITHHCVASVGLGEGERAMLDYYDDRLTLRRELSVGSNCDVLLVQGYTTVGVASVNHDKWRLIWSGARPGDAWQKFWLYKAKL
jgi:4-amino-4-deoxy-L-arabinose transferase-like glycosyltransferase